MYNTVYIGQVQPSLLSNVESIVKNSRRWLNAKSETFSTLIGEDCTRKEVVLSHAVCPAVIVIAIVSSVLEGGAV